MFAVFQSILVHLKDPAYLHVLLNPVPIYGTALGILALILALILRNRRAEIIGLILILIGATSVIPVVHYGDLAYDVQESRMDDPAAAWLDAHGQRALQAMKAFYALIALTLAALLVPWKWPKSARILNLLTLLLALFDFALAGWIGYAGGQSMHPEFRGPPPPEQIGGYDKMR